MFISCLFFLIIIIITIFSEHEHSLLLIDDFGGQKKGQFIKEQDNVELAVIPPGTTAYAQPLDVYVHRPFKVLIRRIVNCVRSLKILFPDKKYPNLHDRSFNFKMISLVHQQLTADIYKPMIRGAWRLSGFDNCEKEEFEATVELQFKIKKANCEDCHQKASFIQCSHCRSYICIDCFLFTSTEHYHFRSSIMPQKIDYEKFNWIKKSNDNKEKRRINIGRNLTEDNEEFADADFTLVDD